MYKIRRFLSVVLVLSICFSMNFKVFANNTMNSAVNVKIIEALRNIEPIKADMGLGDVNFEDIAVSEPVHAYNYMSNGIIESNILYYPLKVNGELVAWAIANETGETAFYQISRWFVDEVNDIVDSNTQFVFVFDCDSSYLYDGTHVHILKRSLEAVEDRGVLTSSADLASNLRVHLSDMRCTEQLGYSSPIATRALTVYKLNITHVTQQPNKKICWAAASACIYNYVKGDYLSAADVARAYYGSSDFNRYISNEISVLNGVLGLSYTKRSQTASADNILYNVQNGYPIFGVFSTGGSVYHDIVIYGINTSNNVIYIMDPWETSAATGMLTGSFVTNKGYQYTSPNNNTLTFAWATTRLWRLGG